MSGADVRTSRHMEIVSRSPFAVGSARYRRASGRDSASVVVKGTFDLRPGECELAEHQVRLVEREVHFRDDPNASLVAAPDLVPSKARVDVLVVGSAFTGGAAARSFVVRVVVAELDKAVEVVCDRSISQHGGMREGAPLTSIPLVYERAAHDPDGNNPVGMRMDRPDPLGQVRLPNLQPTGLFVQDLSTRIPAIGLGPIPMSWPPRRRLWTAAGEPSLGRLANENLVDVVDRSFFNFAPRDQQIQRIQPQERLVLEHLDPENPRLVTTLPGITPRAFIEGTLAPVALVADTLVIDTDRRVCTVTWRGSVDLTGDEAPRVIVLAERNGEQLPWSPPQADMFEEDTHDEPAARPKVRQKADTLPFRRAVTASGATLGVQPDGRGGWTSARPGVQPAVATRPSQAPAPKPVTHAQPAAPAQARTMAAPQVMMQSQVVQPVAQPRPSPPPPAPAPPAPAPPPPVPVASPPAPAFGIAPASSNGAAIPPAYVPAITPRADQPPARVPSHAAVLGTAAASNAAAEQVEQTRREEAATPKSKKKAKSAATPIDLVWVDPVARKRFRAWWKETLTDAEFGDFDSRHERPTTDPEADQAARDAIVVLTREPAADASELEGIVDESVDDHGGFTPPLVVIEGNLKLAFGDQARLGALVALVSPLGATDKRMKDLCDAAAPLLDPGKPVAASIVSRHIQQIREHHAAVTSRSVAAGLDAEVDGVLVDARAYESRTVFGGPHLRSALVTAADAVPAYLPEALRTRLPLFESFPARLIAEVSPRQDRNESHWLSLRVLALARIVAKRGRSS